MIRKRGAGPGDCGLQYTTFTARLFGEFTLHPQPNSDTNQSPDNAQPIKAITDRYQKVLKRPLKGVGNGIKNALKVHRVNFLGQK